MPMLRNGINSLYSWEPYLENFDFNASHTVSKQDLFLTVEKVLRKFLEPISRNLQLKIGPRAYHMLLEYIHVYGFDSWRPLFILLTSIKFHL